MDTEDILIEIQTELI